MKNRIVTQIGSLPFDNVQQAVEYSLSHDIPFLPELLSLGDSMLEYIRNPGRMSCLEEFASHAFDVVKIQCIGPATLVMSKFSEDEAISRIYRHIRLILDKLQAEEVILFLDEPSLGSAGFDYESLWSAIFSSFQVFRGVHCCNNMDWDILFKSKVVDIVSFDASRFDITTYPHYRNGKLIAWGAEKDSDIRDFKTGDLITLPCGMSSIKYSAADCGPALEGLQKMKPSLLIMGSDE